MSLTVLPSHRAPAQQVHGLSMHPKVRAILDKGLTYEWTTQEVGELLSISRRASIYLFENARGLLKTMSYPTKNANSARHRCSGLSLLLYVLENNDEITQADAQPIIKGVLPLLTDGTLTGVIAACQSLIRARSNMPVIVKQETTPPPAPAPAPKPATASAYQEFSFVASLTANNTPTAAP